MEISTIIDHYLDPGLYAPQQEFKPLKAPNCEQDVQRFEAILSGEGPYRPKNLELIMPATEDNAIQKFSDTFVDKVSSIKQSVDDRMGRITDKLHALTENDGENLIDIGEALKLQWELVNVEVETRLVSKSGEKASEGIKTLFRNQ